MKNEAAVNKYIELQNKVLEQLKALELKAMNEDLELDTVHYGHVGDMAHISKVLENLMEPCS